MSKKAVRVAAIVCLICLALVSLLVAMSDGGDKKASLGLSSLASQSPIAALPAWGAIGRSSDSTVEPSSSLPEYPNPNRPPREEAQRLLKLYREKYVNSGAAGRRLLDTIYALGLEKNAENLRATRQFLKATNTNDETVALTRILAGFYSQDNALGSNAEILGDLIELVKSGNVEVGNAATLAYSRLGYFPDSQSVLSYARKSGYIDDGEFYGDLVYLLSLAPKDAQSNILNQIRSSGNAFSVEVLVSTMQKQDDLEKYSPKVLAAIEAILAENQPRFPEAAGQFDLTDATRYAMWLQSEALLNSSGKDSHYDKFVLDRLNSEKTDPRGIISFLISPESEQFVVRVGQLGYLDYAQNRAEHFAAQYVANDTIQEAVSEVKTKLKAARR